MPRATAVEQVTVALRDEILSGVLPSGTPLREEHAAERFQVSRHTVRAAFQRLVAERLAEAEAYRGVRVTSFDRDHVIALQQLRAALESEAVRVAAERFGDGPWPAEAIAPAEAALSALSELDPDDPDWLAAERTHAAFHHALVEASGSPRLIESHAALGGELLLFLLHVRPHYDVAGLIDEHRELLAAVQAPGGAEAVRAHLANSTALLLGG